MAIRVDVEYLSKNNRGGIDIGAPENFIKLLKELIEIIKVLPEYHKSSISLNISVKDHFLMIDCVNNDLKQQVQLTDGLEGALLDSLGKALKSVATYQSLIIGGENKKAQIINQSNGGVLDKFSNLLSNLSSEEVLLHSSDNRKVHINKMPKIKPVVTDTSNMAINGVYINRPELIKDCKAWFHDSSSHQKLAELSVPDELRSLVLEYAINNTLVDIKIKKYDSPNSSRTYTGELISIGVSSTIHEELELI